MTLSTLYNYRCRYGVMALVSALCLLASSCHSSRHSVTAVKGAGASSVQVKKTAPEHVKVTSSMADPTKTLLKEADSWLGTPYRYAGNSKSGVDCSGFVCMVFNNALSIKLPRSSAQQGEWCRKLNKADLEPGDLIFFTTVSGSSKITHVGMYIGDGNMIHASTSKGVVISPLTEAYYARTYHSCGRVEQYYAMISGKGSKQKNPAPKNEPSVEKPDKYEDILIAGSEKRGKQQAKDVAAMVVKDAVDKGTAKLVAATPGEATRAALEKQRRKILDEVVEQKIDSIVSDFFD
ncbi:MAG: C40 family peptidase [Paramuribaculum sp.]|nr:C40 family peptidase [Paramuribaculum sp.]